ncbi:hypothetical protein V6N12_069000 [Hibiscus sabdariffa]|uniref:Uncharacterized protein n=1 Tax=Hibiscus sabdariffa TaxID=183260 RepID=A0ABR2CAD9_9ROSI
MNHKKENSNQGKKSDFQHVGGRIKLCNLNGKVIDILGDMTNEKENDNPISSTIVRGITNEDEVEIFEAMWSW